MIITFTPPEPTFADEEMSILDLITSRYFPIAVGNKSDGKVIYLLAYRKAYGLDDGITQGSQHATPSHETHVPKHIVAQVAVLTRCWLFFNSCDNIPYTHVGLIYSQFNANKNAIPFAIRFNGSFHACCSDLRPPAV